MLVGGGLSRAPVVAAPPASLRRPLWPTGDPETKFKDQGLSSPFHFTDERKTETRGREAPCSKARTKSGPGPSFINSGLASFVRKGTDSKYFSLSGHVVFSVATTQLYHCSIKAITANT